MTLNPANLSPKQLFIIDGAGALLSAFLLGIVLVRFESFFGIPEEVLFVLAIIPLFFAAFDLLCFLLASKKPSTFLKIIALANLSYCLLSLGLAWMHQGSLTVWGWVYLLLEVLIVASLAVFELKATKRLSANSFV